MNKLVKLKRLTLRLLSQYNRCLLSNEGNKLPIKINVQLSSSSLLLEEWSMFYVTDLQ